MNATTQCTPGPWAVGAGSHLGADRHIFAAKGRAVTFCPSCLDTTLDESRANAAFIVEACNNYERVCAERDELATLLDRAVLNIEDIFSQRDCAGDYCEAFNRGHGSHRSLIDAARAALAKVTP